MLNTDEHLLNTKQYSHINKTQLS